MRDKPYKYKVLTFAVIFFFFINKLLANDALINAEQVDIKDKGNFIIASGSVKIVDGNIEVTGKEAKYNKLSQIIEIYGNVNFFDRDKNYRAKGNQIIFDRNKNIISIFGNTSLKQFETNNIDNIFEINSEKIIYDKTNEVIKSFDKTNINYKNDFFIISKNITYNKIENNFYSNEFTKINDKFKNKFELSNFNFDLDDKIFKSENINLFDAQNNSLKVKKAFLDIKSNELVGADYELNLNKSIFGNPDNDPRMFGRYILSNKSETKMKKSTFTTCKNVPGKCPSWSISADELIHKKEKQRIEYKNAWLEIYDVPVVYFPYFFHPDPTVERQSGFLFPQFLNSSNLGFSTQIPYYTVIDDDKDMTLSPRIYTNNNLFIQTEYRQTFKNSKLVTDFSYNKKNNSNYHLFSSFVSDFEDSFYSIKIETVSDNNYLKKYQLKSPLINNYSTLNSSILFEKNTNDYFFSSSANIINDLSKDSSDQYEYIIPNYEFRKENSINNSIFDTFNFNSRGNYRKYNTNVDEVDLVNDFIFSSINQSSNFETDLYVLFKNVNTYGNLSSSLKEKEDSKILGSTLLNIKYPLYKETINSKNFLTPITSIRYSPNKGLDLKNENKLVNFENLFSLERIDSRTVESEDSITLGLEYKNLDSLDREKLKFGIGMNFRSNIDDDIPLSSSLGQKTSDLIGYSGINITENISIDYNFSIDQNLSGTNYSLVSANYSSDKFKTAFEYMEKSNFVGDDSYLTNYTELELNKENSIAFETTKNIDKNITDYYNLIYEYKNDCLKASVIYNKQFYQDNSINSDKNIFFKISFIPFGDISTQTFND